MSVPHSSAAQNANGKTVPHGLAPAVPEQPGEAEQPAGLARPVCVHLGLYDDEKTWLAFPSPGNHCHHVHPPRSVDLVHQQTHCLNANHVTCPVWQWQKQASRLPPPLQYAPPGRSNHIRTRFLPLLVLLVVVLAVVDGLLLWTQLRGAGSGDPQQAQQPTLAAAAVVPSNTNTPTAAPTVITKWAVRMPTAEGPALPAATLPPPQALVTEALARVYGGPGSDYPVLLIAEQGTQYEITGRNPSSDWWRVCCTPAGEAGWVSAEAITISGDTSQTPAIDDIAPPDAP